MYGGPVGELLDIQTGAIYRSNVRARDLERVFDSVYATIALPEGTPDYRGFVEEGIKEAESAYAKFQTSVLLESDDVVRRIGRIWASNAREDDVFEKAPIVARGVSGHADLLVSIEGKKVDFLKALSAQNYRARP